MPAAFIVCALTAMFFIFFKAYKIWNIVFILSLLSICGMYLTQITQLSSTLAINLFGVIGCILLLIYGAVTSKYNYNCILVSLVDVVLYITIAKYNWYYNYILNALPLFIIVFISSLFFRNSNESLFVTTLSCFLVCVTNIFIVKPSQVYFVMFDVGIIEVIVYSVLLSFVLHLIVMLVSEYKSKRNKVNNSIK